ncbi:MAG: GGDEF domain-containing protein [Chloroflexi bacterium]|nr:GGDEF domain-containing protein [Chloroflexota bacterium]MBI2983751.1 GGDEF domain-containing protein [Chloroflexota bacterium]
MIDRRPSTLAWRLQGFLGHPIRFALVIAILIGIPMGIVLVDEVRNTLLGPVPGRIVFVTLLVAAGATIGATAGQLISSLRSQAFMDTLTGLYNRRFMDAELGLLQSRAGRYGHDYSVLVLDIDGLKTVNDTYGHDAGDIALRAFADVLRAALRGSDVAIRTGGDEFVAILPETPCHDAHIVFDRIRRLVTEMRAVDPRMQITVSAGAVGWKSGRTLGSLVQDADALLLNAKRGGRDRLEAETAVTA